MGSKSKATTPPESEFINPRRSLRLTFAIPVTLTGKDGSGQAFKENTRTTVINKHGAGLRTSHKLALGAEVLLENRALSRAAKASVVWLGKKIPGNEQIEIGVELANPENIWGIEFPPDDWEESSQLGTHTQGHEPETAALPPKTTDVVAPIGAPEPVGDRPLTPAGEVKMGRPPASGPAGASPITRTSPAQQMTATADAQLVTFRKQIEEAENAALKSFAEKVVKFSKDAGLRVQANLQDRANQLEDRIAGLLEEKAAVLTDRAQASWADLEALLAELQELGKSWESEIQKTRRNIQSASFQALESATEELNERLRKGAEKALEVFLAEARQRLKEEHQKQLADISSSCFREIQSRADGVLAGSSSRFEEMMRTIEQEHIRAVLEHLRGSAENLVASAESELHEKAEEASRSLRDLGTRQFETELRKVIDEQFEQSAAQMRKLAEDTLELAAADLNEKEQQSANQAFEMFRNRIGEMISALQSTRKETGE